MPVWYHRKLAVEIHKPPRRLLCDGLLDVTILHLKVWTLQQVGSRLSLHSHGSPQDWTVDLWSSRMGRGWVEECRNPGGPQGLSMVLVPVLWTRSRDLWTGPEVGVEVGCRTSINCEVWGSTDVPRRHDVWKGPFGCRYVEKEESLG